MKRFIRCLALALALLMLVGMTACAHKKSGSSAHSSKTDRPKTTDRADKTEPSEDDPVQETELSDDPVQETEPSGNDPVQENEPVDDDPDQYTDPVDVTAPPAPDSTVIQNDADIVGTYYFVNKITPDYPDGDIFNLDRAFADFPSDPYGEESELLEGLWWMCEQLYRSGEDPMDVYPQRYDQLTFNADHTIEWKELDEFMYGTWTVSGDTVTIVWDDYPDDEPMTFTCLGGGRMYLNEYGWTLDEEFDPDFYRKFYVDCYTCEEVTLNLYGNNFLVMRKGDGSELTGLWYQKEEELYLYFGALGASNATFTPGYNSNGDYCLYGEIDERVMCFEYMGETEEGD